MSSEYDECLQKGKIKPFSRGSVLAAKELETAASDLDSAEKTFSDGNYKWATIQVYYAMFHAARALLYSKDMRERSHYCLMVAVKELFINTKLIPAALFEALKEAKICGKMPIITTGGQSLAAEGFLPAVENLLILPERFFLNNYIFLFSQFNSGFRWTKGKCKLRK